MTPDRQAPAVPETPEHRGDRRRFLIWACMLGAVPPERVTERVLEELATIGQEPTP